MPDKSCLFILHLVSGTLVSRTPFSPSPSPNVLNLQQSSYLCQPPRHWAYRWEPLLLPSEYRSPGDFLRTDVPNCFHIFHLRLEAREKSQKRGQKYLRFRAPGHVQEVSSSREGEVAPMTSLPYCFLNKTCTVTTPVTFPHG